VKDRKLLDEDEIATMEVSDGEEGKWVDV